MSPGSRARFFREERHHPFAMLFRHPPFFLLISRALTIGPSPIDALDLGLFRSLLFDALRVWSPLRLFGGAVSRSQFSFRYACLPPRREIEPIQRTSPLAKAHA